MNDIAEMIRKSISERYTGRFTPGECENNNHYFVRYNEGNMICMKCGRFAKLGQLRRKDT